ncbi:hypothetical protein BUALT_Bualt04G0075200 [Buddleja alternifolia]|uniref:Glutamate receptor n=1 Tax=Buddleja alternifolia TaxID=168488 RepID=A0AAV6XXV0_9LAMI|nr:hypothetical protein BUALT_Bualt04G0075200 [Buddleja alternifolia]
MITLNATNLDMEKISLNPFLSFSFLISLKILGTKMGLAQIIPIRVGVVLDIDDFVGEMGVNCISMALSDFYASHPYYKTRLVLNIRDSKGDVLGAAAAALYLLKNVEVHAIIGPLLSEQANFLINLGDKAQVPIITFSATSPSLSLAESSYFVRATLNDSSQVQAISAIIQSFGWREIVPIYEGNEFGEGLIPFLADALEKINARVTYRSHIHKLATDEEIVAELSKLMKMQTRVFVVHMRASLASRLFAKAKQLGMVSEGYVWIITNSMTNELNSMDASVIESMQGVIGVQPYTPITEELNNFEIRYKERQQQSQDLNMIGLWAYDSTIALAVAVEKARLSNTEFQKSKKISKSFTDLEDFGVSSTGPQLIKALSTTTFNGLAGNFQLVDGQLQSPPYQIINVVGPRARVVGYWTKNNGIVKELNGWTVTADRQKMRIGVPVKKRFTEFLRVIWNPDNSTEVNGYCIEIFHAMLAQLPYDIAYEFIPFATPNHESAGNYDGLVYQLYLGNYDAVVGDRTILAKRAQYVDFSVPYTESGVSMVVRTKDNKSTNAWEFLKPLTWELWLTSFCSIVFIGFLIWLLEHRINDDFRGPPRHQVGMIFWFSFSTVAFAHKERVISNLARFVLIIWFLVVLILTQSYTASFTTILTVEQLQPTFTNVGELIREKKRVGYQNGSNVPSLLKLMLFSESRLVAYNTVEEMDELLSKGSGNGAIAAAFDEIPYIKFFLARYCRKYSMVGPVYKFQGFGFFSSLTLPIKVLLYELRFRGKSKGGLLTMAGDWDSKAFPKGSPLASDVSRAIINVTEGITAVSSFTIYVTMFLSEIWDVIECSDPEFTRRRKLQELFRRFDKRDTKFHTFKSIELQERNNGCNGDCLKRVMESSSESRQQSPSSLSLTSPRNNDPQSPVLSNPTEQNITFQEDQSSSENKMTIPLGEASEP